MKTKKTAPTTTVNNIEKVNGIGVEELAQAFERAGLGIQWVGKDQGKPMTVGSLDLTELLKVIEHLPIKAPAIEQPAPATQAAQPGRLAIAYVERAQLDWLNRSTSDTASIQLWRTPMAIDAVVVNLATTTDAQSAPASLFADAVARLAAHDHAAATDLADKYRAALSSPTPATAQVSVGLSAPAGEDDVSGELKTVLHQVARRGHVDPEDVTAIVALVRGAGDESAQRAALATVRRFWAGGYWEAVSHADCEQIDAAFAVLTANQN